MLFLFQNQKPTIGLCYSTIHLKDIYFNNLFFEKLHKRFSDSYIKYCIVRSDFNLKML